MAEPPADPMVNFLATLAKAGCQKQCLVATPQQIQVPFGARVRQ